MTDGSAAPEDAPQEAGQEEPRETRAQRRGRLRRDGLRRSNPLGRGYRRVRSGRGFSYKDLDGATLTDRALRARIEALAIPPAWTDVWIAPYENGHIQAVGVDAQSRKQYIYHPTWRERESRKKYDRMLRLAAALPKARKQVTRHLRDAEPTKRRALAAAFRMLDLGGLRIGSPRYLEETGSRGLTTLLNRHAEVEEDRIHLRFPAKSHKEWDSTFKDRGLAAYLREMAERGPEAPLVAYREGDEWRALTAQEINKYVKKRTGGSFSAKDFRTLRGTVTAARSLAKHGLEEKQGKQKRAVAQAMRDAAEVLSNTPTIAKASYVDPRVVDHYRRGDVIPAERAKTAETEVLALLAEDAEEPIGVPTGRDAAAPEQPLSTEVVPADEDAAPEDPAAA